MMKPQPGPVPIGVVTRHGTTNQIHRELQPCDDDDHDQTHGHEPTRHDQTGDFRDDDGEDAEERNRSSGKCQHPEHVPSQR